LIKLVAWAPQPPDLTTVVCVSRNSIPLLVCPLYLENDDQIGVSLPVVAVGISARGRMIYVGSLMLLVRCAGAIPDCSMFLESLTRFLEGDHSGPLRILLLALPVSSAHSLQRNLSEFRFDSEIHDQVPDLRNYRVIVTTVDFPTVRAVREFLDNNGSVMLCGIADRGSRQRFAALAARALEYGLGLPACSLVVGDAAKASLRLPPSYAALDAVRFSAHVAAVTALRYYVAGLLAGPNDALEELSRAAWRFLDASGGFFRCAARARHRRAPRRGGDDEYDGVDRSAPFPGRAALALADFQVQAEVAAGAWCSTGRRRNGRHRPQGRALLGPGRLPRRVRVQEECRVSPMAVHHNAV
jgi:hypothetical protein